MTSVESLRPLGQDDETRIGVSIGVGQIAGGASFPAALREADAQLYCVKSEHHSSARLAPANVPALPADLEVTA